MVRPEAAHSPPLPALLIPGVSGRKCAASTSIIMSTHEGPRRPSSLPPAPCAPEGPAPWGAMESTSSGRREAPKRLGLSFSIEEILKRPGERRALLGPEEAGGGDPGPAAAAGSLPGRPPQDQPQGKCLLVISLLFPGLPGVPRQGKADASGLVALNAFLSSQNCGFSEAGTKARSAVGCGDPGLVQATAEKVSRLFTPRSHCGRHCPRGCEPPLQLQQRGMALIPWQARKLICTRGEVNDGPKFHSQ